MPHPSIMMRRLQGSRYIIDLLWCQGTIVASIQSVQLSTCTRTHIEMRKVNTIFLAWTDCTDALRGGFVASQLPEMLPVSYVAWCGSYQANYNSYVPDSDPIKEIASSKKQLLSALSLFDSSQQLHYKRCLTMVTLLVGMLIWFYVFLFCHIIIEVHIYMSNESQFAAVLKNYKLTQGANWTSKPGQLLPNGDTAMVGVSRFNMQLFSIQEMWLTFLTGLFH